MGKSAAPGRPHDARAGSGDGMSGDDAVAPPWGWFWAKTGADGAYLPLLRHLEDVAAVARRLWDIALTDRQRAWFATGFGMDETSARGWIVFLAAAHDLGKANPGFQWLAPDLAERLLPSHLRSPRRQVPPLAHDTVSGAILMDWLTRRAGLSRDRAERLAATVSGHHSVPKASSAVRAGMRKTQRWGDVRWELAESLARRLGADRLPTPGRRLDAPTVLATAGLICVADWIGSDQIRFPVTGGVRPSSEKLAREAVRPASWAPRPLPGVRSFAEVFEFEPRASQQAAWDAVAAAAGERFLLLIEDRPGSGKTEAALMAALQGLVDGCRGMYVGMPTQATANQLHRRTKGFLDTLWPGDGVTPRLLHGGVNPYEDLPVPSGVAGDSDGDEVADRDAEAQAWFAQSRRGLLSPYGVGTVDQALLATLAARHYPVRMLGLQGKVVILDEVHAYDAYTGHLLEALVEWLSALDCTVILLSATLPPSRRRRLIDSYLVGCRTDGSASTDEVSSDSYPRVTVASPRLGLRQIAVEDDRPGREIELSWEGLAAEAGARDSDRQARAIAKRALREVEHGGCLAIVCSTVAEAQGIYTELRDRVAEPQPIALELLHSRLRRHERDPVERRLLSMLGPPGGEHAASDPRPERLIVVATQVIEQSLDIDFDVMFSFLAPVDLLIQRAGRVHRHSRPDRPGRHRRPRLVVLDSPGEDPLRAPPAGSAAVYVEATLVRTRLALLGRESLREPEDLDPLIAAVYEEGANPSRTDEERQHVERLDTDAADRENAMTAWAEYIALRSPFGVIVPWELHGDARQAPEHPGATVMNSAATRYSERPSLSVIPLFPDELPGSRRNPSGREVGELLRWTVPVSSPRITRPLLDAADNNEPADRKLKSPFLPPSWMKNGRLRHHFLVELDEHGVPRPVDSEQTGEKIVLPFRLDRKLGLIEMRGEDEV